MALIEFTPVDLAGEQPQALIAAVQQEYVERYGSPDVAVLAPEEFAPPKGIFVVGRDGNEPVACGGFRVVGPALGELKRMYVVPTHRRRGVARWLLRRLEDEAVELGVTTLRLETGLRQPEAIALYEAEGYTASAPFGPYAGAPLARHFAKRLDRPPR